MSAVEALPPVPEPLFNTEKLHIYAEFRARGRDVVVARSRQELPHVWLFLEGCAAFDLDEEQARTLRDALDAFLEGLR